VTVLQHENRAQLLRRSTYARSSRPAIQALPALINEGIRVLVPAAASALHHSLQHEADSVRRNWPQLTPNAYGANDVFINENNLL